MRHNELGVSVGYYSSPCLYLHCRESQWLMMNSTSIQHVCIESWHELQLRIVAWMSCTKITHGNNITVNSTISRSHCNGSIKWQSFGLEKIRLMWGKKGKRKKRGHCIYRTSIIKPNRPMRIRLRRNTNCWDSSFIRTQWPSGYNNQQYKYTTQLSLTL